MRSTTVYEIAFAHPAEVVIGTNFALVTLSHQRVSETTVALDAAMNLDIFVKDYRLGRTCGQSTYHAYKALLDWLGRLLVSDAPVFFGV